MDRFEVREVRLHALRQRLEGGNRVGEDGIAKRPAVALRHLLRIKQRAAARAAPVGGVGMPGEAGIGQPDVLAALVTNVGDQQDLGKARVQVFLDDVNFQRAEPAAEFDVPLI